MEWLATINCLETDVRMDPGTIFAVSSLSFQNTFQMSDQMENIHGLLLEIDNSLKALTRQGCQHQARLLLRRLTSLFQVLNSLKKSRIQTQPKKQWINWEFELWNSPSRSTVRLWDLKVGKCFRTFDIEDRVTEGSFSPEGLCIVINWPNTIYSSSILYS